MEHIEFTDKEVKAFHRKIIENIKRIRKEKGITQLELALNHRTQVYEYYRQDRSRCRRQTLQHRTSI